MMQHLLTRAERPTVRFELALVLTLVVGCSVELVGVDRATILRADAGGLELDTSVPDADLMAADVTAAPLPERDASSDAGVDATSSMRWTDPQRPAPLPGQFVDPSVPCPAAEPVTGASCGASGQQCDYPVCWGGGQRSWVCVEQRFVLWFDESFLCATSRPCPRATPREAAVCTLSIECLYPYFCCKGPEGFQAARCDGHWSLAEPVCAGCVDSPP